jgi:hypothetical protein
MTSTSTHARRFIQHICDHCVVEDDQLVGRVSDLSYGFGPEDAHFLVGEVIGEIVWVGEWRFRGRLCYNSDDLCRPVCVRGRWGEAAVAVTLWELPDGWLLPCASPHW